MNIKGFSIVSVMVAIGLIGIITMVITGLYDQQIKFMNHVKLQSETDTSLLVIKALLRKSENCRKSLLTNPVSGNPIDRNFPESGIVELRNIRITHPTQLVGTPVLETGKQYQNIRINKISFRKFITAQGIDLSGSGANRMGEILLEFSSLGKVMGASSLLRSLPVQVMVEEATGKMLSCSLESMGGESGPGAISKYGDGQRCKSDEATTICGVNPGHAWNYNYCFSSRADIGAGFEVNWHPGDGGYRVNPMNTNSNTKWAGIDFKTDVICTQGIE